MTKVFRILGLMALTVITLCLLFGFAAADPGAPPSAASTGLDAIAILVGVSVILGAIGTLLGGASAIGHVIARRTKTTADDRVVALIDAFHGRVDGLEERLEELIGAVQHKPVAVVPPRDPQAGKSTPLAMVGLAVAALFAVLLTCALTGCTHEQRSDAKHAAIACAKADALPIAVLLATWALDSLSAHKVNWQAIEIDAVKHGSLIGGCAADKFVAATTAHASASVLPMAPSEGERMLERLRAQWGGAEWSQAETR